MFHVLIVDDEIFSVEAVLSAIDWKALQVDRVFSAYDMDTAKKVFDAHTVDVMLCDIEMPNGSGIELAAWVKEHAPKTVSLFLTCHSDFQYAKDAVSLGAFEYLLKPMEYDKLQGYLARALAEYQKRIELKSGSDKWLLHHEIVEDKFWSDLLLGKCSESTDFLLGDAQKKDISLSSQTICLPILVTILNHQELLSSWYGNDLDFAFRNIAYELFSVKGCSVSIAAASPSTRVILVNLCPDELQGTLSCHDILTLLKPKLLTFSETFQKYFHAKLSVLVGRQVPFTQLSQEYTRLTEKADASYTSSSSLSAHPSSSDPKFEFSRLKSDEWTQLIFSNRSDLLLSEFDRSFSSDPESSLPFYDLLIQSVFLELLKRNISAYTVFSDDRLQVFADNRTPEKIREQLSTLCLVISEKTQEFFSEESITDRVKVYITHHLTNDLSREMLAGQFFLNPNYLSRLFKKETGISLQDYILKERMKKAAFLLDTTPLSVSEVHEQAGFSHSSYFSKMFKREFGMTPQEYRRKNSV